MPSFALFAVRSQSIHASLLKSTASESLEKHAAMEVATAPLKTTEFTAGRSKTGLGARPRRDAVPYVLKDCPYRRGLASPSVALRKKVTHGFYILDRILKAYIEDVKSPEEIASHYELDIDLVRSVARKVDRNEYKRRQAPRGLKITSRAFSLGRPFPIVQKFVP
jgi:NAD synthase